MNYFISGGCKNGKSFHAQRVTKKMSEEKGLPLYYIATMIPIDKEDNIRINRHVSERAGWGFKTIEQPLDILGCLDQIDNKGVILFDSVTALLMNEMFPVGREPKLDVAERIAKELEEFCMRTDNTVFVSDYIYSDCNRFDDLTDKYREGLALLDKTLANACDRVVEVAYGFTKVHK